MFGWSEIIGINKIWNEQFFITMISWEVYKFIIIYQVYISLWSQLLSLDAYV